MEASTLTAPREAPAIEVYPWRHAKDATAIAPLSEITVAGVYLESPLVDGDAFEVEAMFRTSVSATSVAVKTRIGNGPLNGRALGSVTITTIATDLLYKGMWSIGNALVQGAVLLTGPDTSGAIATTIHDAYIADAQVGAQIPITYLEFTVLTSGGETITIDAGKFTVYHSAKDPNGVRTFDTIQGVH